MLSRGKLGGHVGVVSGIDKSGNPIIISGNHGHRVGEAAYPRGRVIAYVMPSTHKPGNIQLAARSRPHRAPSERVIDSPITELLAAIAAEQNRRERPSRRPIELLGQLARASLPAQPSQPASQAQATEPHQSVKQNPEFAIDVPRRGRRVLPIEPGLVKFLGITGRARERIQAAPPPAPTRQRQVQQNRPTRIANAAAGLAGALGLR